MKHFSIARKIREKPIYDKKPLEPVNAMKGIEELLAMDDSSSSDESKMNNSEAIVYHPPQKERRLSTAVVPPENMTTDSSVYLNHRQAKAAVPEPYKYKLKYKTSNGHVYVYRCRIHENCQSIRKIVPERTVDGDLVYRIKGSDEHSENLSGKFVGIHPLFRTKISELITLDIDAQSILDNLKSYFPDNGALLPTVNQLNNLKNRKARVSDARLLYQDNAATNNLAMAES